MAPKREFDVVIFGATGFTGKWLRDLMVLSHHCPSLDGLGTAALREALCPLSQHLY
jgi:short subunit dehydrogenase-like uncharacterized protein